MFELNTAEKIETVAKARVSGKLGEWLDMGHGRAKVCVDGDVYLVSGSAVGWLVAKVGSNFVAEDADLYTAAKMAVHAG